eukprot:Awhi_evm1s2389
MSDPSTKSPILVDNDISLNARMAGSSSVDPTPSEPDSIENGSGGDTNQPKRSETVTFSTITNTHTQLQTQIQYMTVTNTVTNTVTPTAGTVLSTVTNTATATITQTTPVQTCFKFGEDKVTLATTYPNFVSYDSENGFTFSSTYIYDGLINGIGSANGGEGYTRGAVTPKNVFFGVGSSKGFGKFGKSTPFRVQELFATSAWEENGMEVIFKGYDQDGVVVATLTKTVNWEPLFISFTGSEWVNIFAFSFEGSRFSKAQVALDRVIVCESVTIEEEIVTDGNRRRGGNDVGEIDILGNVIPATE